MLGTLLTAEKKLGYPGLESQATLDQMDQIERLVGFDYR